MKNVIHRKKKQKRKHIILATFNVLAGKNKFYLHGLCYWGSLTDFEESHSHCHVRLILCASSSCFFE